MYKESKDTTIRSKKAIMTISVIATLLVMSTMSITITPYVNALDLDLDNFSIDDLGQSAECVIVVVGCDGTGSVGSSGDTIIGSNNGNDDNNTNGGGDEPGTLTVFKEVECRAVGGTPTPDAVCAFALASPNFPQSSDYPITVSGNNPDPSNFDGSASGTSVSIGPGEYVITEELASTAALQSDFQSVTSLITTTTAEGDCTPNFNVNNVFEDATGTMTSGGSQECTIVNTITITGGVVPQPPEI
jgi:hypothetical protein